MKLHIFMISVIALAFSTSAFALDVKFADNTWDGVNIPKGQQCQKFGGTSPATPKLIVSDIPAGSNSIILEYSDRDSKKMDNGGHGIMKFAINSTDEKVEIPSVSGHTFELPAGFTMIEAHRGAGWDKEGAYMPPCSGGKDHAYYLTVKSLMDDKVTAEVVIELGKY
jgi:phosphatidylethanolamine-binding protein (PEBP) family uncharacterized protein